MLPRNASEKKSESWDDTMKDVERTILPSITYWQHSRFHACFSAGNTCLACTELEPVILDRLDHIMSLPIAFLSFNSNNVHETETSNITIECESICSAGGVVLGSESECILVTMLAIKTKKNGKQTIRKSFNGKWTNII
ncbi:unnamed protein product [Rotaria sordida]|uniref:Uncharacterized protein n=1 Tax=Rotaria sordida TaxID=392033 RepID=A0A819VHR3_9BILA|nr:unnamed protein product [Rotaria sordida]